MTELSEAIAELLRAADGKRKGARAAAKAAYAATQTTYIQPTLSEKQRVKVRNAIAADLRVLPIAIEVMYSSAPASHYVFHSWGLLAREWQEFADNGNCTIKRLAQAGIHR